MRAQSAAALPTEILRARRFIPSLSAYAVDLVLRQKERQAACARLLAAAYLLDLTERRLFRELGYSSAIKFMVTGAILLAAVTLDTVSRRRLQQAGR